jgi:hypothetical protein
MAKRKAAGGTRKAARKSSRTVARSSGRKPVRKAVRKAAKPARRSKARGASKRAGGGAAKKTAPKAVSKRKAAAKSKSTRSSARVVAKVTRPRRTAARKAPVATPRSAPPARARGAVKRAKAVTVQTRKAPALDRERRSIADEEEMVPSPPSSLDLDRTASAARSGRRQVQQRFSEHTETSPALTGGDVDADWESAYSVGDEAPGGDNPTPDQDIVDDIGKAVGVQYDDNEELKGADKVAKRDAHRWELDPASAEDWEDRD